MKGSQQKWLRLTAVLLCGVTMVAMTTSCCCIPGVQKFQPGQAKEEAVQAQSAEEITSTTETTTTTETAEATLPTGDETLTTSTVFEAKNMYVVADGGLRMRQQPSTSAKIILTIPNKTKVLVVKEQDDWSFVRYKKKEGWCSSAFLFPSIAEATTTAKLKGDALTIQNGIESANSFIRSYRGKTINGGLTKANPTTKDILTLFEKAEYLYDRAANFPMCSRFSPYGYGTTYTDANNTEWVPGMVDGYASFAAYCEDYYSCLSDDISYKILKDELALIDGKLYCTQGGIGAGWPSVEISHKVEKDDNRYVVTTTVIFHWGEGDPDEVETYVSICEKEGGNWVFTKIEAIPYN